MIKKKSKCTLAPLFSQETPSGSSLCHPCFPILITPYLLSHKGWKNNECNEKMAILTFW